MNRTQTNAFIKERGILLPNKQIQLTEAIWVYKKVCTTRGRRDAIASLIIPIGAIVNLAQVDDYKMRASHAYCFDITTLLGDEIDEAVAPHYSSFKYFSGKKLGLDEKDTGGLTADHECKLAVDYSVSSWNSYNSKTSIKQKKMKDILLKCKVKPDQFDYKNTTCSHGVHFFIDIERAKNY